MSRSMPPAALALLAAVLVLAALPPIGVDVAPNASAGHAAVTVSAQLPSGRSGAALAWDGENAYVLGGRLPSGVVTDEIVRYTPSTDTMVTIDARLPAPLAGAAAVWAGDAIYIFGGSEAGTTFTPDILRFDPVSGTVEAVGSGHLVGRANAVWDPRDRPAAGCPEGCAYIIAGFDPGGASISDVKRYNPTLNTFSDAGSLSGPHRGTSAAWDEARGWAWVFGVTGTNHGPGGGYAHYYDPLQNGGDFHGNEFGPRYRAAAAWIGSTAYVFGGNNFGGGALDSIASYSPATGTWTERIAALPFARQLVDAFSDGTSAYIVGGEDAAGAGITEIVRYTPGPDHPPRSIISPVPNVECDSGDGHGTTRLSAAASFDPEGAPLEYEWFSPDDVTFDDETARRPFATGAVGTSAVKLRVDDGALQDTSTASLNVVDSFPPTTVADLAGLPGNDPWWRSPVDAQIMGSDACGVDETFVSVNEQAPEPLDEVHLPDDGNHTLAHHAVDLGGNQGAPITAAVSIDATAPHVEITRPREGGVYVNDVEAPTDESLPHTVLVGTTTLRAVARDGMSGMRAVDFLVDGVLYAHDETAPHEFVWNAGDEAAGTHRLTVRAFDKAGNDATVEMDVTTVPTTQRGVLRTADFGAACRLVLGPAQCDAVQKTIDELDPAPTTNLVRDTIDQFLRQCEETLSPTICALLPDELPGDPSSAPRRAPPERDRGDAPRDGAVAVGAGGEPE